MSPPDESPPTRRSPGTHQAGAPNVVLAQDPSMVSHAGDIPAQLRCRRAASYRLPPLDDGRRDVLGGLDWDALLGQPIDFTLTGAFLGDGRLVSLRDVAVTA